MSKQTTDQRVRDIKQRFRQMMDGATAQSMRDKGLGYRLNWGATIPRLRQMAEEIKAEVSSESGEVSGEYGGVSGFPQPQNIPPTPHPSPLTTPSPLTSLSIALWKEDVRECKILATMLMPPGEMLPEVVDIWMEQTSTLEIAEQAAFNLYQHLPYAADKAFEWLASPSELPQICGYHVFSRLFKGGQEPNERGINEFIDQAVTVLSDPSPSAFGPALRKAAMQAVIHFADISLMHRRLAQSATKRAGLSFL